jgi:integrase
MPRIVKPLTPMGLRHKNKPGRFAAGDGLYLLVKPDGSRYWCFRWRDRITGKLRDKGLGPVREVELTAAREAAKRCKELVRNSQDPIGIVQEARAAERLQRSRRVTFGDCCDRYIAAHRPGWRNAKHSAQWKATLDTYAGELRPLTVDTIETAHVMKVLEPIWTKKTETATRVRQRIEAVLSWAAARKYRSGENPAAWRGHLDKLLPKPAKLKDVTPRAALPYSEIAAFMAELRGHIGFSARALELHILCANRPGEAAGARWEEVDLDAEAWTIPASRIKSHREHRIPLSPAAVKMLRALPRVSEYVFPSNKADKPITTAAMLKMSRSIRAGFDVHGFRSTFRDWTADCTSTPREIAETALAHANKDKTEAAYMRSDLFEKRRRLMDAWAKHCATAATARNVTPIRKGKAG